MWSNFNICWVFLKANLTFKISNTDWCFVEFWIKVAEREKIYWQNHFTSGTSDWKKKMICGGEWQGGKQIDTE